MAVKPSSLAASACSSVADHLRNESKGASSSAIRHSKKRSEKQSPLTESGRRVLSEWSVTAVKSRPSARVRSNTSAGRELMAPSE